MRRVVLAAWLAACASSPPEATVPADRAVRYAADTVAYHVNAWRLVEQDIQGQTTRENVRRNLWLRAVLGPSQGDTLTAQLGVDSITEIGSAFPQGDLIAARGVTWTARLAPNGHLMDFAGPTGSGVTSQLFNTLRDFYPRLPPDGVEAGDRWVDTVTQDVDLGGVIVTVTAVHHHEALGMEPHGAEQALRLRVVTDYALSGSGSQSGQPLSLDGTGRRHADEWISPRGRYLGSIAADTAQFEILLTALGMSIPVRQWRADTTRVVR
jgi:hypothetical protein